MDIKLVILFLFCATVEISFCQMEQQRKYSIENPAEFLKFVESSQDANTLSSHFHSKNTYFDLYLDTPENLLLKNNLSLRFRKRVYDSLINPTYTFQLKNEMLFQDSSRMEIEETELSFYSITTDTGWISMTVVLDSIFSNLETDSTHLKNKELNQSIAYLESWIAFKAGGAIAPFQKLIYLGLTVEEIKKLKPVIYGHSERYRSHIYTNNDDSMLEKNKIKRDKLPLFFLENPRFNWLLESSFDISLFSNLNDPQNQKKIIEFEVENKYFQKEKGTAVLSEFEIFLRAEFNAIPKIDSKYKQAITLLKE